MKQNLYEITSVELQMLEQQFTPKSEIAKYFLCSEKDLDDFVRETYDISYQDFHNTMVARGRASILQKQYNLANKNPNVAIFLGKQYCGQTEDTSDVKSIKIVNDIK